MTKILEPTSLSKPKILPEAYFFYCILRLKFPTYLLPYYNLKLDSCRNLLPYHALMSDSCLSLLPCHGQCQIPAWSPFPCPWPMSDSCQVAPKALHTYLMMPSHWDTVTPQSCVAPGLLSPRSCSHPSRKANTGDTRDIKKTTKNRSVYKILCKNAIWITVWCYVWFLMLFLIMC